MFFYCVSVINSQNDFTWGLAKIRKLSLILCFGCFAKELGKKAMEHAYWVNILCGLSQCSMQKHMEKLCISCTNVISHV